MLEKKAMKTSSTMPTSTSTTASSATSAARAGASQHISTAGAYASSQLEPVSPIEAYDPSQTLSI